MNTTTRKKKGRKRCFWLIGAAVFVADLPTRTKLVEGFSSRQRSSGYHPHPHEQIIGTVRDGITTTPPSHIGHTPMRYSRLQSRRMATTIRTASMMADDGCSGDITVKDDDQRSSSPKETLWSYVFNLQKGRKEYQQQQQTKNPSSERNRDDHHRLLLRPAHSLLHYLNNHPIPPGVLSTQEDFLEACERALTQAMRACGEAGEYRLILQLLQASIVFANDQPILSPRIFGEAVTALSKTAANVSKLKQVWKLVGTTSTAANGSLMAEPESTGLLPTRANQPYLTRPPKAFELSIMLQALASRDRVKAAVDLYRNHTTTNDDETKENVFILPDAYVASVLFRTLTDSITNEQESQSPPQDLSQGELPAEASTMESSLWKLTKSSPCWQWNAAVDLLATLRLDSQWNNHAFSSLLKLQNRAQSSFKAHYNGPRIAVAIWNAMRKQGIVPDVITCTVAIKAMGDPKMKDVHSWQMALHFLKTMQQDPILPMPNEHTFSAAIVACARCNRFEEALELLEEMRTNDAHATGNQGDSLVFPPKPNTWVYNAALLAVAEVPHSPVGGGKRLFKERQDIAFRLLEEMKQDYHDRGLDTKPDVVSYNTVLSALHSGNDTPNPLNIQRIDHLLADMKEQHVQRDVITYRNAIVACQDPAKSLSLLEDFLSNSTTTQGGPFLGKATGAKAFVFNAAFTVVVSQRDMTVFHQMHKLALDEKIACNDGLLCRTLQMLAATKQPESTIDLLKRLSSTDHSTAVFEMEGGLNVPLAVYPQLSQIHFTTAIEALLQADELNYARKALVQMRKVGVKPTLQCLEGFALAYARSSLHSTKSLTLQKSSSDLFDEAVKWAKSAHTIVMDLTDPSTRVLAKAARASAATGQWLDAQLALRKLHQQIADERVPGVPMSRPEVQLLWSLHSGLLKDCVNGRNVSAALRYASDIQRFSRKVDGEETKDADFFAGALMANELHDDDLVQCDTSVGSSESLNLGMRAEDWVSLAKAAASTGHWQVCVNTLQLLKPYIEEMSNSKGGVASCGRYESLAPALAASALCLEKRGQYAWGLRTMRDWMEWSGFIPRPVAVMATIRNLCANGQEEQAKDFLYECVSDVPEGLYSKRGMSYQEQLTTATVTVLHNGGLYDDADEVFMAGVQYNYIPFSAAQDKENHHTVVDLHGLNVALTHSTVRSAMRQQMMDNSAVQDLVIVTGRGRNSESWMRPVLRPEVQRMLLEEFYPPLNTVSVPGNMGAILVSAEDITAWQSHQAEQKGAQMLNLAAILKDVSQTRLQRALELKFVGPSNFQNNDSE